MTSEIEAEFARNKRAKARRTRSATVVFKKIHKGLYISHEHGMGLSHEAVWSKDEGRKWVLSWKVSSFAGLFEGTKVTKKFDSIAEARSYANALLAEANR